MRLNDFGLLLTSAIDNTNPNAKKELISLSDKENRLKIFKEEKENKRIEYYKNTFENKRENDKKLYEEYLEHRKILYNKWRETKGIGDLQELITYKLPEISDIPEIYTSDIKKSKLKTK